MNPEDVDRWRRAIGANADRYLGVFERFARDGREWPPSWNTAAFLHSTGWFCYRRMYGWALLNFLTLPVLFAALVWIATTGIVRNLDPLFFPLLAAYGVTVFILVPIYADALYYRRLKNSLARAAEGPHQASTLSPSGWTRFGAAAFGFSWLVLLTPVVVPVGYTERAKLSEAVLHGSTMRTAITEFYEKGKQLPTGADSTRFREEPESKRVKSVIYDSGTQTIVITMRDPFPDKRLGLQAEIRDGKLVWTCRAMDIEKKHMPQPCRN